MIRLHPQPEALEDPYPAALQALNDVMKFARQNTGAMSDEEMSTIQEIGGNIFTTVTLRDPASKHLVEAC